MRTHTNTQHANNFINLGTESLQCKNIPHESNPQVRNTSKECNNRPFYFPILSLPDVSTTVMELLWKILILLENVHAADLKSLSCEPS